MPPRKTPSKKNATGDGGYTPWTATAAEVCAELGVGMTSAVLLARRGEAGAQVKVYEVDGPLFFASAMPFIKQARDHRSHPNHVTPPPSRDPSPFHTAIT